MSTPSEDFYAFLKGGTYSGKYLDRFNLTVDPVNPMLNVVPLTSGDFFGCKVCNIVCITGPLRDWDNDSVSATMSRLAATYPFFASYQTHFIIDGDAEDVQSMSDDDLNATQSSFDDLIATYNANSLGVFYWGKLNASALQSKINQILSNFYS